MNEKIITEQYADICTLLGKNRLKEALMQLESFLWQCPNWDLRNRLEQVQTSYKYMLEYMRQGVNDPKRRSLYKKLVADTWDIADQARLLVLDTISSKYYHKMRHTPPANFSGYDLKSTLHTLESFNDDLMVSELVSDESTNEVLKRHEDTLKLMFLKTWTSDVWSPQDNEDAKAMLGSELLPDDDLCLFVSALTLSLQECFDCQKIMWLLDACEYPSISVGQRALVGVMITSHIHRERLKLYPKPFDRMMYLIAKKETFMEDVACIYRQMLLCQETEKIDRKMKEEVIPELLKNVSMKDILFDPEENDEGSDDKNPDWGYAFNTSILEDKLREMSELQLEGADVYMSTFSPLKNYPFFNEMHNWFYPFSKQQADVFKIMKQMGNPKNSLLNFILQSGFFSNSDKYSFFFTVHRMSPKQQEMIASQISEQQMTELEDQSYAETMRKFNRCSETVSNQYLHDLYRFFKLSAHRNEFRDFFKEKLDFYNSCPIVLLSDLRSILVPIADFYVSKERWDEAIEIFEKLEADYADGLKKSEYYQKFGYVLQKKKNYAKAIQTYLTADTLRPNNAWTNHHLAICYRLRKNYHTALAYYKKVEEVEPKNLNATFYIGSCLAELKQYEEALNYFFKLDLAESNCIKAWRGIAWCSFASRKDEQAMKYYEKIIEQKPLAIDYMNAGHVAWAMGNIQQAAALYGKAITAIGNRDRFLEAFHKDKDILLNHNINEEDIPLMTDLL